MRGWDSNPGTSAYRLPRHADACSGVTLKPLGHRAEMERIVGIEPTQASMARLRPTLGIPAMMLWGRQSPLHANSSGQVGLHTAAQARASLCQNTPAVATPLCVGPLGGLLVGDCGCSHADADSMNRHARGKAKPANLAAGGLRFLRAQSPWGYYGTSRGTFVKAHVALFPMSTSRSRPALPPV